MDTIVSTKGAVVIPADIRKKLGILPGRKVSVIEVNGKVQIIPLSDDPVTSLRGCLKGSKPVQKMIEEARDADTVHESHLISDER